MASSNKLEFIPGQTETSILPSFELRGLGAAYAIEDASAATSSSTSVLKAARLSGRAGFTIRQGYDPIDQSSTGRVVEGRGDAGITLRRGPMAFSLTAANISYRTGLDDPLAAAQASVGESTVPSLKVTAAREYKPDSYVAVSYDIKQRKPEVSLAWSGSTLTEKAALVLHADPLMRTYKMAASVAFPGPEWRETVYDEDRELIEDPADDGARHRLWVTHTVRDRQWAYRTRLGASFDLGRLINYVADYVDYNLEPRIPGLFWRLPFSQELYNLVVPAEDENQVRHHIKGWDLEVAHEFGRRSPVVGLAKHFKYSTLRATYDTAAREAGLQYQRSGLSLTAKIARQEGGGIRDWLSPSLHIHVEPLGLL